MPSYSAFRSLRAVCFSLFAALAFLAVPKDGFGQSFCAYSVSGPSPGANFDAGGTSVSLGDDASTDVNIGFIFRYFGNAYTRVRISSNGYVVLGTSFTGTDFTDDAIPNTNNPNNMIAGIWDDLNPASSITLPGHTSPLATSIGYELVGSAPNRRFIVKYTLVPHFTSSTQYVSFQIYLYESTNIIEIHTLQAGSDGGTMTQGIENINGTAGYPVSGRNSQVWSVNSPESVAFIPQSDNTAPTISCPSNISLSASSGQCSRVVSYTIPSATDNCDASVSVSRISGAASGSSFGVGTSTIQYSATDDAGNVSNCSFTVTISDNQNPVITSCPGNQTVSLNNSCQGSLPNLASSTSATDNCGVSSISQSPAAGTTYTGAQNVSVTITASDASGRTGSCVRTVSFVDQTNPIIGCPSTQNVNLSASCSGTVPNLVPLTSGSDNCSTPTITQSPAAGTAINGIQTGVVTMTATAGGRTATCQVSVNYSDVTGPTLNCSNNQTIQLDGSCSATLPNFVPTSSVSDNCDNSPSLSQSPNAGNFYNGVQTVNVTLTGTDNQGNQSTCIRTVSFVDQVNPSISCPGNSTAPLNSSCVGSLPNLTPGGSSNDNCDASPTISQAPAVGTNYVGAQTVSVTLTSVDDYGNSTNCVTNVTFNDITNPSLTCASNQTVNLNGSCSGQIPDMVALSSASDNCDNSVSITQNIAAGTTFSNERTVNLTITATDDAGNTSSCVRSVIFEDNTAPSLSCSANQTIQLNQGCQAALPNFVSLASATDNCDNSVTITQAPAAGSVITGVQTVTVTVTATDDAGNTSTCLKQATFVDQINPTIHCPGTQTSALNNSCNGSVPNLINLSTYNDNCDNSLTLTQSPASGSAVQGIQTAVVTLTATDDAGNAASCTANVEFVDQTGPTLICAGSQTVDLNAACRGFLPDLVAQSSASDNCDATVVITQNPPASTMYIGSQSVTVTITARDDDNNVATCTAVVNFLDNSSPSANCPGPQILNLDQNCQTTVQDYRALMSTSDNCDVSPVISQSPNQGVILTGTQVTTVSLTSRDNSANEQTCTFNLTLQDVTKPSVSCPGTFDVTMNANCEGSIPDLSVLSSISDNCTTNPGTSQSPTSGTTISGLQNVTTTLTVTDGAGNSEVCNTTVRFVDNTAPVISCVGSQTVQLDASCNGQLPNVVNLSSTNDNCDANPSLTQSPAAASSYSGAQLVVVTLSSTDASNNTGTCLVNVNFVDNIDPVVTCPATQVVYLDNSCGAVIPAITSLASATDNCTVSPTLSQNPTAGTAVNVVQNATITIIATDASGNTDQCPATVQFLDTIKPVLNIPPDLTLSCDQAGNTGGGATSIMTFSVGGNSFPATYQESGMEVTGSEGSVTILNNRLTSFGATYTFAPIGGGVFDLLSVVISSGGSRFTSSTGAFIDVNIGGVFTFPTNSDWQGITSFTQRPTATSAIIDDVSFSTSSGAGSATATDNCDSDPFISFTDSSSGSCINFSTIYRTWTATDASGNSVSGVQQLTVQDTSRPTAACKDITIEIGANGIANVPAADVDNGSADDCSNIALSTSPASFDCSQTGFNSVVLTVSDDCTNTATCAANVKVEDNTVPTLNCPGPIAVDNDQDVCGATVNFTVTQSDNCVGSTLSQSSGLPSGSVFPVGTTNNAYRVVDASGNEANCSFTVTVTDVQLPTAACNSFNLPLDANGAASITVADVDNNNTDNCTIASKTIDNSAFSCADLGNNTVVLTVSDVNGNSNTCAATIAVLDVIAPIVNCFDLTIHLNSAGTQSLTVNEVDNASSDNCTLSSLTLSQTEFDCSHVGTDTLVLQGTDQSGNVTNCLSLITVVDSVPPIVSCKAATVEIDANGTALLLSNQVNDGSSDVCGVAASFVSPNTYNCSEIGAQTTVLVVIDNNGNTNSCQSSVTVEDNLAPQAVCAPFTVELDANGNATLNPTSVDGGSTDNCSIVSSIVTPNSFDCNNVGSTPVLLVVTDAGANTSSCNTSVQVRDTTAPVMVCQNVVLQLDNNGQASLTASDVDNGSSDVCGMLGIIVVPGSFDCNDVGTNAVQLIGTDIHNNNSTCTATVTVQDTVPPVAACQNAELRLDSNGTATVSASQINLGSVDDCGIASATLSDSTFDCTDLGVGAVVTLTVTDNNGNASSCTAAISVKDSQEPTIACPADTSLSAGSNSNDCSTVFAYVVDVDDNCSVTTLNQTAGFASGASFPVGTTINNFTVEDGSGNQAQCSFTVTVVDDAAPTVVCADYTANLNSGGTANVAPFHVISQQDDNCGIAALAISQNLFGCSEVGANAVVATVTDVNGNATTCSATVTVQDLIAPQANCQDTEIYLDQNGNATVSASTIDNNSTDQCGLSGVSIDSTNFDCTEVGPNTVILTATDVNGNVSTCSAIVGVADTLVPTVVCPANIAVNNDAGVCLAVVSYTVQSDDNCGTTQLNQIEGIASGGNFPAGTTNNAFLVSDDQGSAASCSFTVTVTDNEAPQITCPASIVLNNEVDECGAVFTFVVTSSDNCTGSSHTQTVGAASGSLYPVGSTTNTFVVTDAVGLTSACSFDVTVNDIQNPIWTSWPIDRTVFSTNTDCSVAIFWTEPLSADNCAAPTVVRTDSTGLNSGDSFPSGETFISYSSTDTSGNVINRSFRIVVIDNTAPEVTCPVDIVSDNDLNTCSALLTYAVTGTDNCTSASVTQTGGLASGSNFPQGTTSNSFFVIDGNGNTNSCSFDVTVNDTEAPRITCPADINSQVDSGTCDAILSYTVVGLDNCGTPTMTLVSGVASGGVFNKGTTTNVYQATDAQGFTATCSFDVTLIDAQFPTFTVTQTDLNFVTLSGQCGANYTYNTPQASDNCPGVVVTRTSGGASGDFFTAGSHFVEHVATDASGNAVSTSFFLNVEDVESPRISCPASITVANDPGECGSVVNYSPPNATDNCTGVVIALQSGLGSGSLFPVGIAEEIWEASDAAGNNSTCEVKVTVIDAEPPTVDCTADLTVSADQNACEATVNYDLPIARDNCGSVRIRLDSGPAPGSTFPAGTTRVTFRIDDFQGNVTNCSFNVTVIDNVPPTADCSADVTVDSDPGSCGAIVNYKVPNGDDNCPGWRVTRTSGQATGSLFEPGTHTVAYRVTDNSGNVSDCDFNITVTDLIPANAVCRSATIDVSGSDLTTLIGTDIDGGSTDNCDIDQFDVSPNQFDCSDGGLNVVTLTVTDAGLNTSTCTAELTVRVSNYAVSGEQKISQLSGNLTGNWSNKDFSGQGVAGIGDLDRDGNPDIAVGLPQSDYGKAGSGGIWILFLNADRTVKSHQIIANGQGGLPSNTFGKNDRFGSSIAQIGDVNGDGVNDLAAGAPFHDGTAGNQGGIVVLLMNPDGTINGHSFIRKVPGINLPLSSNDWFGASVTGLGDFDGDNIPDILVGAPGSDLSNSSADLNKGAVWFLALNADGSKKQHFKVTDAFFPGGTGGIAKNDKFGTSVTTLNDIDGNGVIDVAVGAPEKDHAGSNTGAVYVLLMNANGSIADYQIISASEGNLTSTLDGFDLFGFSVNRFGDIDHNGVDDLLVGAPNDDDKFSGQSGSNRGAMYMLMLNSDASVLSEIKVSQTEGGFNGPLDPSDKFGEDVGLLMEPENCKVIALAGASNDDDGGSNRGAVYLIEFESMATSFRSDDEAALLDENNQLVNSIDELNNSFDLSIYPNPNTGLFNIELDVQGRAFTLEVIDQLGREMVKIIRSDDNSVTQKHQVNLADAADGIYYVRLTVDGESVVRKVLITK